MHQLGKKWTKDEAISEYKRIIRIRGDLAKSSNWMKKNGYSALYKFVRTELKLSWNEFKRICGVIESPLNETWTKDKAIQGYREIRRKHGDFAKSSSWLIHNGYKRIYQYIHRAFHEISWNEFKRICGFNDDPPYETWTRDKAIQGYREIRKEHGDLAKSSDWMRNNGYSGLLSYINIRLKISWNEFKRMCGFPEVLIETWTKDKAIQGYREIRKEHGDLAKSSDWMKNNGYGGLLNYIRNTLELSWNEFKTAAGFRKDTILLSWDIESLGKRFNDIFSQYGILAKNSEWLLANGNRKIVFSAIRIFGRWSKFIAYYNFSYPKMSDKDLEIKSA